MQSVQRRFSRVAVLMGGDSTEREVSLRSGAAIARGLRSLGYTVDEVDVVSTERLAVPREAEAVFVALHGTFGEDGGAQALLRAMQLPYTGSSPEACRRAFDKTLAREDMARAGVPVPAGRTLYAPVPECPLPLPVVVKPARQGSSVGCHRVCTADRWAEAYADAARHGGDVIVETFIPGRELTVGIVADEALPVVEIVAPDGDYNYRAKYTPGLTEYRAPAPLPESVAAGVRADALRAFAALKASDFGRADFRLAPDGRWYALELNSIPGFTETSLLPKAAAAAGISFPELCDRILNLASVR
jgi:D-alanine-D-alanine ligase